MGRRSGASYASSFRFFLTKNSAMGRIAILSLIVCLVLFEVGVGEKKPVTKLQIGVKKRIPVDECNIKSRNGDTLHMHYTGTLHADGSEFDSSISGGSLLLFHLGAGRVIKGWDQGLVGMCEGEKRKLIIPPHLGYGISGSPPKIPGESVLVFEVELLKIDRKSEL